MATDKHHHETLRYMGEGKTAYPPVQPHETPMQVAIREAGRTIRTEAIASSIIDLFNDYVNGSGILFRQEHPEVQQCICRLSSIYGLTK